MTSKKLKTTAFYKVILAPFLTKAGAILFSFIILFCSQGICWDDISQPSETNGLNRTLHFAYWLPIISSYNPNDAKIAIRIWAEKWGKSTGIYNKAEAYAFHDSIKLQEGLKNNIWDVIMLPIEAFLIAENREGLRPDFTIMRGGVCGDEYVLLVHRESGIDDLSKLRGRSLITTTRHNGSNMIIWLDSLLEEKGLPPVEDFLSRVTGAEKEFKSILPVFFRKVDACITSKVDFEVMSELNPQVRKNLKILEASPRLIPFVLSIAPHVDDDSRKKLLNSILYVVQDKDFKQILTLNKIEGLALIDKEAMAATRKIYKKRLQKK